MSRAYKVELSESLRRHVKVEDGIKAGLEILDVLPREQMAELLRAELETRGFERREDGLMRRIEDDGTEVTVDPVEATVTIRRESAQEVEVSGTEKVSGWEETAKQVTEAGQRRLQERLEGQIDVETERLRDELNAALEKRIGILRGELDDVTNRVVAEGLKRRAAQLGEVTSIAEDPATGAVTIKVRL